MAVIGRGARPPLAPVTLVLGGARSGKSAHAERLIEESAGAGLYLATAEPGDAEMAARIREHRARRGDRWRTREAPLDLVPALVEEAGPVLVDCLTLWLANLIEAGRDVAAERDRLTETLVGLAGPVVLVANEVGLGIVPDNPLARRFRDHAGRLNQEVAAAADQVIFLAAGLAMVLKDGANGSAAR